MNKLIVLHGATAVGKSSVSISLANHLSCPIINADSRQLYKEMTIGTAVPGSDELRQAEHYFIHSHSIHDPLTAGSYSMEALTKINTLFERHENIILSGGSGLYIKALLEGMDNLPTDSILKVELNNLTTEKLQNKLRALDKEFYDAIDKHNRARLIRAVEVCLLTGRKYSLLRTGEKTHNHNFEYKEFVLDRPREELYDRINQRVDIMLSSGLEQEVRDLLLYKDLAPLNTVGYKEFFDYFDGNISFDTAVELIKRNSRRYAKRQYTWLRSIHNIEWFSADNLPFIFERIDKWIKVASL